MPPARALHAQFICGFSAGHTGLSIIIPAMSTSEFRQTHVQQMLLETADSLYQSSDQLIQQLHYAAQALMHGLTNGGKVLCAGQAEAAWLAQQAANLLLAGQGRERPPLAAHALQAPTHSHAPSLAQQLRALGHPGDIWLAFSLEREETALLEATRVARDLDLTLVLFTGEAASVLGPCLRDTDVWVPLPGAQPSTLYALAWLALHCLCAAVDNQLLGEEA